MHKGLSFIMMILLLFVGFQQAIIMLHFKLNQKRIEDNYCINKNRPNLHCAGNCFLLKQLKKTEKTESSTTETYQRVDILPSPILEIPVLKTEIQVDYVKTRYKIRIYEEPFHEIFKPPPIS